MTAGNLVIAGIMVIATVLLGGCGSLEVAFGVRTRLDKLPIVALSATLNPAQGIAAGGTAHLVITATAMDGTPYVTEGAGHGKVLFDSFSFEPVLASVNSKGVVSLPDDPRLTESAVPHVKITAIGHRDVSVDLPIPVRYDVAYSAHFSGAAGSRGFDGMDGIDGIRGADGTANLSDASAPMSAGGNGSDGGNGGDGGSGWSGAPGEDVKVWVTLAPGTKPLLQVRASSSRHERLFLIDPAGGTLSLDANGGPGGSGGKGGRGGRGGAGGNGFPPGLSGHDGMNGSDGLPGQGGAAGKVTVSIDPKAQAFAGLVHISNKSGDGAAGSAPTVIIEDVAPLW